MYVGVTGNKYVGKLGEKVKLPPCLIFKYHAMKTFRQMEVLLHHS
jgi:outer membrane protein W